VQVDIAREEIATGEALETLLAATLDLVSGFVLGQQAVEAGPVELVAA
jgi:hypothetical protein